MQYKQILVPLILSVISLLIVIGINIKYQNNKPYETEYFRKAGITSHYLKDFLPTRDNPEKEEIRKCENEFIQKILFYPGYVYYFSKQSTWDDEDYFLDCIEITDVNYRLGKKHIGINSSIEEVKRAYSSKTPIVECDIGHGYVDRFTYIEFEYDVDNKVRNIIIYTGP